MGMGIQVFSTVKKTPLSEKVKIYDIAIIGGGLAGLTLAIQSANAGYQTILFEKESYPFHKVCGEYISMESYDFLSQCGVPLQEWDLPMISKLHISDCEGRLYAFQLPLGGFGISRFKLDHALATIARQKKVELCEETKVEDVLFQNNLFTIDTKNEKYTAKIVAGSFGKRSNLDIKWRRRFSLKSKNRLNNYIGVKYHIKYDIAKDLIALHNFQNGYCGISKIEDDTCCVCYLTTADQLSHAGNTIEKLETTVLSKNQVLAEIFSKAQFLYEKPLTIAQISFDQKEQVENHILMVGDAAGLITPLCGNGMSMAMNASSLAFQQMKLFLEGNITREQMEKQYNIAWKRQFSKRLIIGRLVQSFFGNPFITRIFLYTMSKTPRLANWLIRQTHGSSFA